MKSTPISTNMISDRRDAREGNRTTHVLLAFLALMLGVSWGACASPFELAPDHTDDAKQRWRDIGTNLYSEVQQLNYAYEEATVTFDLVDSGPALSGTITGSGLKPNFAYQLKFEGKPTLRYGELGDDVGNESIGYAGRWWVREINLDSDEVVSEYNGTDSGYEAYDGIVDGDNNVHCYTGYLLFDFLVTDANGSVQRDFTLDSSYHVLFKTSQATPRDGVDSEVTYQDVVVSPASEWYVKKRPTKTMGVFAEWQSDRPLPGTLEMPFGDYDVLLNLSEESFHETAPGSGNWATVMSCEDFLFSIVSPPEQDAAVLGVTAPGSIPAGDLVDVTVTVANQGLYTETIEVSLSDESTLTLIGTNSITLDPGQSGNCVFEWSTDGAYYGEHLLVATATPLPLELDTDLADNSADVVVVITDPASVTTLTVSSLSVRIQTAGANVFAVADVVVTDGSSPIDSATVTVMWELDGEPIGSAEEITDGTGAASLASLKIRKLSTGVFTATVTNITKSGCQFDEVWESAAATVE
ncbi:MAG: hypothetical protein KAI66_11525 [Lentisphaeria bacterium]|nr:hypothetical protein [Lentisphaeria bacterium]